MQQVLVAVEDRGAPLHGDLRLGAAVGVLADQPGRGRGHPEEVDRHVARGAHPAEVEELAEQPAQALALPDDQLGQQPVVGVGPGPAGQLLDRAADRGQRVADLVGQRGRQRRDRLEPLGPQVEILQPLEVRDVGEDGGHRGPLVRLPLEGGRAEADREGPAVLQLHQALLPG